MDMSALLLQMCAGNPGAMALLQRMQSGERPDLRKLVEEMSGDNPNARLIAEQLRRQEEQERERAATVIDIEAAPAGPAPALGDESAVEALAQLRGQMESLFAEMSGLRTRLEDLAWALGACPLCWGEDADCRSCRGRGRPGFRFPEPDLFTAYVVPAVRLWRMQRTQSTKTAQPRPTVDQQL